METKDLTSVPEKDTLIRVTGLLKAHSEALQEAITHGWGFIVVKPSGEFTSLKYGDIEPLFTKREIIDNPNDC